MVPLFPVVPVGVRRRAVPGRVRRRPVARAAHPRGASTRERRLAGPSVRIARSGLALAFVLLPALAGADAGEARAALAAGDCRTAGAAINRGMDAGDAESFFLAGYLYEATGCVPEDPARAARFYRHGAELGNDDAARSLGLLYGLGRGVARDYAEAYRWFAKAQAGGVDLDGPRRVGAGYAMTVVRLAQSTVRYPTQMERNGVESSFDVVFVPATGTTSIRNQHTSIELGSRVARTRQFVDPVVEAYERAVAELARPDGIPRADAFVTPWRFAMRRTVFDEAASKAGAITLGDTQPVAP